MPLTGKWITRQGNEVRHRRTPRRPVDLDSGRPEFAQRAQKSVAVVDVLQWVAHKPNGAVRGRPLRVAHSRTGQAAARTNLDQDSTWSCQHRVQLVGEPDGELI